MPKFAPGRMMLVIITFTLLVIFMHGTCTLSYTRFIDCVLYMRWFACATVRHCYLLFYVFSSVYFQRYMDELFGVHKRYIQNNMHKWKRVNTTKVNYYARATIHTHTRTRSQSSKYVCVQINKRNRKPISNCSSFVLLVCQSIISNSNGMLAEHIEHSQFLGLFPR